MKSNEYNGEDRRARDRFACSAPAAIRLPEQHGGVGMNARTADVSPVGVRLLAGAPLPENAEVKVEICLPHYASPVLAACRVVWSRRTSSGGAEIGLEFTKIEKRAVEKIEQFIELAAEGLIAV